MAQFDEISSQKSAMSVEIHKMFVFCENSEAEAFANERILEK